MAKKVKPKLGRSFGAIIQDDTQVSHKKILKSYVASEKPDKKIVAKQKASISVKTKKPEPVRIFKPVTKRRPEPVKTKKPDYLSPKLPESIPKIFSDFYSIIQDKENILDVIKVVGRDKSEIQSLFKQRRRKDFKSLHSTFFHDKTKEKKVFNQVIKDETKSGISLLKDLKEIIENKHSEEELSYRDLLNKKGDMYSLWSNLAENKERLQDENKKMTEELDKFLKKKSWLVSKREYINFKSREYGGEDRISELFEQWSEEHKELRSEDASLKAAYEKATQDVNTIPKMCGDIKKEIETRQDEMALAKYEIKEILKVYPDIEEKAKESQDIVLKYSDVHKNLEEKIKTLKDFKEKFTRVDNESKALGNRLSGRKKELEPFLKTQNSLKNNLGEITDKFNMQEEIIEEKRILNETVKPLEKSVQEWKKKINSYETKSAEMNEEIKTLKEESLKAAAELKELNTIVGPAKELKGKLDSAEKEISIIEEQDKKFTEEVHTMRKENEILSVKASQYEMIKKKLGGIK